MCKMRNANTDRLYVEVAEGHDGREHAHLALGRFGDEDDEPEVSRALVVDVLVDDAVHQRRHLGGVVVVGVVRGDVDL